MGLTPSAPRPEGGSGAWGILGGTFDPLHYGHLALAENAREELGLEGVLFLPAGLPPHKPDRVVTPAADRIAMVEAAVADHPAFRLSRLEVDRPGPSYAVDTVAQLVSAGAGPDRKRFIWLMSSEALAGLPDWHQPRRLLELVEVAVSPRLGFEMPDNAWLRDRFPGLEDRFLFLDGPVMSHAASRIRWLVGEGRSIRYLVPPAVAAYIEDHGLYATEARSTARA